MGASVGRIVVVRQGDTDAVGVITAVGEREVFDERIRATGEMQATVDVALLATSLSGIDFVDGFDDDQAGVTAARLARPDPPAPVDEPAPAPAAAESADELRDRIAALQAELDAREG